VTYPVIDDLYSVGDADPPFHFGYTSGFDMVQGDGSPSPGGGETPSVLFYATTGISGLIPGEKIYRDGRFVGTMLEGYQGNAFIMDVVNGSYPVYGSTYVGKKSGVSFSLDGYDVLEWPSQSYINKDKTAIWVTLEEDTIRGASASFLDPVVVAYVPGGPYDAVVLDDINLTTEEDYYTGWKMLIDGQLRKVVYQTNNYFYVETPYSPSPEAGYNVTLHPPKSEAHRLGVPFMTKNSRVSGLNGTGRIAFAGPSYIIVSNIESDNPYTAFRPGDVLSFEDQSRGTVGSHVYVYPDYLNRLDRKELISPETRTYARACISVGSDGANYEDESIFIFDDVEIYKHPYDASYPLEDQTVPCLDPGLFWWFDKKLVYKYDNTFNPVPSVDLSVVSSDPEWNSGVLHDITVCRSVSCGNYPPGLDAIPNPAINTVS
jgi:hypothetical protein